MERDLGSLILATDISRQNEYLTRFRVHLDQENLCLSKAGHRHFILQVDSSPLLCYLQPLHLHNNNKPLIQLLFLPAPADGSEVRRHL